MLLKAQLILISNIRFEAAFLVRMLCNTAGTGKEDARFRTQVTLLPVSWFFQYFCIVMLHILLPISNISLTHRKSRAIGP